MSASPSRLNIQRQTDIDWLREFINPNGTGKIQECIGGRSTEDAAIERMAYGELITATNNAKTMNGQFVDLDTQLYCSRCGKYLFDSEFPRNRTFKNRRGRAYVCKVCVAKK